MQKDIKERTFQFALMVIKLISDLPRTGAGKILGSQVLRSGTSVGANVEEAAAAYSHGDFAYRMNVALKEARETHYWLRLLGESAIVNPVCLNNLLHESEEIKKILGAIMVKLKKHAGSKENDQRN